MICELCKNDQAAKITLLGVIDVILCDNCFGAKLSELIKVSIFDYDLAKMRLTNVRSMVYGDDTYLSIADQRAQNVEIEAQKLRDKIKEILYL